MMSDFDYQDELDHSINNNEGDGEDGRRLSAADPNTHKCGVKDVPFSTGINDSVSCLTCGAQWTRSSNGWNRNPSPSRNRDYRKKTR